MKCFHFPTPLGYCGVCDSSYVYPDSHLGKVFSVLDVLVNQTPSSWAYQEIIDDRSQKKIGSTGGGVFLGKPFCIFFRRIEYRKDSKHLTKQGPKSGGRVAISVTSLDLCRVN